MPLPSVHAPAAAAAASRGARTPSDTALFRTAGSAPADSRAAGSRRTSAADKKGRSRGFPVRAARLLRNQGQLHRFLSAVIGMVVVTCPFVLQGVRGPGHDLNV